MAYITIADTEVDPEAPITSYLGYRFRDNPIAIAERASGAPRVKPSTIEQLSGSGNWTVPAGVKRVKVLCIGAGGGSGGAETDSGGGGASVIGTLEVVPATDIAYSVGAGGAAGGASPGVGDGGDTEFDTVPIAGGPLTAGGGDGGAGAGFGGSGSGGDVNVTGGIGHDWGGGTIFWTGISPADGNPYGGGGKFNITGKPGFAGTIILEY